MANPIKQFEIKPLMNEPLMVGGLDLSFTNSAAMMMLAVILSTVFLTIATRRKALVPGRMQIFAEGLYGFVAGMIRENIGAKGRMYFPLIFTLFVVVLMGNMLGMVPLPSKVAFTYTSHIAVTGALAFMIFLTVLVIGFAKHGFHFFSLFLPPGVPAWLVPLILPIEIMSFLTRPITLSVRLFANMIAGHIMLKVFAGFSVGMAAAMGTTGILAAIGPMLFNVIMIGFEILIAFLQAYVFAILSCIYLKDTVEIDH